MTSFEGRVIAITGGASGIGFATARLLASRGASISVADVRQGPLDEAVADIRKSNLNMKIFAKAVDVRNGQEVGDWLDETIKHLGPLSGAVNLAGVIRSSEQIVDTKDEDWDLVMDVNVKGVFNCIRAELQRMDKDASIVSASSAAGLAGYPGGAAYCASKVRLLAPCRLTKAAETRSADVQVVACGHRPYTLRGSGSWREEHQGQLYRPVSPIQPAFLSSPPPSPFLPPVIAVWAPPLTVRGHGVKEDQSTPPCWRTSMPGSAPHRLSSATTDCAFRDWERPTRWPGWWRSC